jgi:hypothetical protein
MCNVCATGSCLTFVAHAAALLACRVRRLAPPMALSIISTSNFRLQGSSPLRPLTRSLHTHGSHQGITSTSFVNAVQQNSITCRKQHTCALFQRHHTEHLEGSGESRVWREQPRTCSGTRLMKAAQSRLRREEQINFDRRPPGKRDRPGLGSQRTTLACF